MRASGRKHKRAETQTSIGLGILVDIAVPRPSPRRRLADLTTNDKQTKPNNTIRQIIKTRRQTTEQTHRWQRRRSSHCDTEIASAFRRTAAKSEIIATLRRRRKHRSIAHFVCVVVVVCSFVCCFRTSNRYLRRDSICSARSKTNSD